MPPVCVVHCNRWVAVIDVAHACIGWATEYHVVTAAAGKVGSTASLEDNVVDGA